MVSSLQGGKSPSIFAGSLEMVMISLQFITKGRWIDTNNVNIAEVARKGIIQTAWQYMITPRIEDETFYNNIVVSPTVEMVDGEILGRPDEGLFSCKGSDTSASRQFRRSGETVDPMEHNAGFVDPCEVVRVSKAQVEAKMIIAKKCQIARPYPGTQDLNSGLKCGLISNN